MEKNGQHGTVSNAKNVKKRSPEIFLLFNRCCIAKALGRHCVKIYCNAV